MHGSILCINVLSARARSLFSVDNLPLCLGFLLLLLLLPLLWLLHHGEHKVNPLSGAPALLALGLHLLLLQLQLLALMGVACLLVAAARRPLSPWLAAATAALEAHGDGLNCAVLRVYHGDVWKTTAGLTTGLLPGRWLAPEMALEIAAVTVVIVVACRCLSWSSLSLLWLADTGMGDSITLLASPWESALAKGNLRADPLAFRLRLALPRK